MILISECVASDIHIAEPPCSIIAPTRVPLLPGKIIKYSVLPKACRAVDLFVHCKCAIDDLIVVFNLYHIKTIGVKFLTSQYRT